MSFDFSPDPCSRPDSHRDWSSEDDEDNRASNDSSDDTILFDESSSPYTTFPPSSDATQASIATETRQDQTPPNILICQPESVVHPNVEDVEVSPLLPASPCLVNEIVSHMTRTDAHEIYNRAANQSDNLPQLDSFLRATYVAILSEQCKRCSYRRETFYLAVDYLDRFSVSTTIDVSRISLIATACLMIATKVEENSRQGLNQLKENLKLMRMSHSANQLPAQEATILKALNWRLHSIICNGWLTLYMQKARLDTVTSDTFFAHQSSYQWAFINISRLLELSLTDSFSRTFRYSVLTASALYHFTNIDLVTAVSDKRLLSEFSIVLLSELPASELEDCVRWMNQYAVVYKDMEPCQLDPPLRARPDEVHTFHQSLSLPIGLHIILFSNEQQHISLRDSRPVISDLTPKLADYLVKSNRVNSSESTRKKINVNAPESTQELPGYTPLNHQEHHRSSAIGDVVLPITKRRRLEKK